MENEETIFTGFCRIYIVDADGLSRKTKGSCVEAPLHMKKESDGSRKFIAVFPPLDPISLLKVHSEEKEFLCAKLWLGPRPKADEHPNPNRSLCAIQAQNCKKLNEAMDANPTINCDAFVPFVQDCYEKPVKAHITFKEKNFICRVVRMEVTLPENIYNEWDTYIKAIKAFEKEDKDKDKDKDEKK